MNKWVNEKNIERWSGFSDLYDKCRPIPPEIITRAILLYLKGDPEVVVDLGSGTGLSTMIWNDIAREIIGIEPNDDMREKAEKNTRSDHIHYKRGVSNETGLPSDYADIVTVSQAFHWMDIDSTLTEIYRILKEDGVLAIFDCDWPPSIDWVIETAYQELKSKSDAICCAQTKHAEQNDKNSYLNRIRSFGKFRFSKEIVCHSVEECTPERMIEITLSQGSVQSARKLDPSIRKDIDAFCHLVNTHCTDELDIVFSYRLRIAVKSTARTFVVLDSKSPEP